MKDTPNLEPRLITDTAVDAQFYEVFPDDLNALGTLFGGRLMEIGDRLASSIVRRHCQWPFVTTVSVDSIRFLAPAYQGEVIMIKGSINRAWGSSLEIGVKVLADDFSGKPLRHIFSAYYTFCALNRDGKPVAATPAIPDTPDQKRRHTQAQTRREHRLTRN
jgi:acyl-CoA hydrolase